jgi:hypothetical protein
VKVDIGCVFIFVFVLAGNLQSSSRAFMIMRCAVMETASKSKGGRKIGSLSIGSLNATDGGTDSHFAFGSFPSVHPSVSDIRQRVVREPRASTLQGEKALTISAKRLTTTNNNTPETSTILTITTTLSRELELDTLFVEQ